MLIELVQLRTAHPTEPEEEYADDLHDVNAIIMDMCIALGETHSFEFRISGFGDDSWPVDVMTDMATILEQLPGALEACAHGTAFELNLFEQGVERRLEFEPSNGSYAVRCSSLTTWKPEPEIEEVRVDEICSMLHRLKETFCEVCERLLPAASAHPWFRRYAHDSVQ